MKIVIIYFSALFLFTLYLRADNLLSSKGLPISLADSVFSSSNLPIVIINTNGQEIKDDYKITADMGIIYNGEGIRNSINDPYNNYNGKIGIEIRGSSSQMFPKKQYAVETRDLNGNDENVSLLGMPSESDWILFAPYNDKSLMRDVLAYRIANDLGRYASRSKFCEVVINGEYKGIYVLLEKIKRDANRVNIKKIAESDTIGDALTGGYIIKIDKMDGENNDGWASSYFPAPGYYHKIFYQYHYPEPDEITDQQKNYIKQLIFNFETIMNYSSNISDSATGYPKYLDIDSFVDFIIINELTKNVDAYRLSTFFYKDRDSRNPKLFAGPVWDFNLGFGNADYYNGGTIEGWNIEYLCHYPNMNPYEYYYAPNWWLKLFRDSNFRIKFSTRWNFLRGNVLDTERIAHLVDSLKTMLDEAKTRNFQKWPVLGQWIWPNYFVGNTYDEEISFLKSWITNRITWMDSNITGNPLNIQNLDAAEVSFYLKQNFPNPFNPLTTIEFSTAIETNVQLKIYDVLGNEIATLVNENKKPGTYKYQFNAEELSSGVYFYKLIAGDFSSTKKLVLIK